MISNRTTMELGHIFGTSTKQKPDFIFNKKLDLK
jgi:hypothetical protein